MKPAFPFLACFTCTEVTSFADYIAGRGERGAKESGEAEAERKGLRRARW